MKFAVGDSVEWTSSSAGITRAKEGAVVAIVPAHINPNRVLHERRVEGGRVYAPGMPRRHESYVIRATADGRKRARLYWPRVSLLRKVEEHPAPVPSPAAGVMRGKEE